MIEGYRIRKAEVGDTDLCARSRPSGLVRAAGRMVLYAFKGRQSTSTAICRHILNQLNLNRGCQQGRMILCNLVVKNSLTPPSTSTR
jgi:hypothetical protein